VRIPRGFNFRCETGAIGTANAWDGKQSRGALWFRKFNNEQRSGL